jgi:hypothetical protein
MDESPYQLYADLLTEKDRPDLAQLNCGALGQSGDRVHGKPSDREWRYSHQVISHLRYEAIATLTQHLTEKRNTLPILTLYVHQDNAAAIRLYENFGFLPASQVKTNDHIFMSQKLDVAGLP